VKVISPVFLSTSILPLAMPICSKNSGLQKASKPLYLFKPLDKHYPLFYVHSNCRSKYSSNILISITNLKWDYGFTYPSGSILDVFGCMNDISVMEVALANHYDLIYKSQHLKHKPSFPQIYDVSRNHISHQIYTIDPNECTDIDDAFSIYSDNDNITHIWIHISDVYGTLAHWYQDIDNIILEHRQYETLYLRHKIEHMLYKIWSSDLCSLKENQIRNMLSLHVMIKDENIITCKFMPTSGRITKNYDYDSASKIFIKYYDIVQKLYEHFMNKYKFSSFSKNENFLKINDTHSFIEAMMIIYNLYFGNVICNTLEYKIIRIQKSPKYSIEYQNYDKTLIKYLNNLSMNRGLYEIGSSSHYKLNVYNYTHATSPIRRRVDLLNQMMYYNTQNLTYKNIYGIVSEINNFQKKTKKMYRELNKLYLLERVYYKPNYETRAYIYQCNLEKNKISLYFPNEKLSFNTYIIPNDIKYLYSITCNDNTIIIINNQTKEIDKTLIMMELLNVRINGQPKLSEIDNIMIEYI
jgi:exoribonuclease R